MPYRNAILDYLDWIEECFGKGVRPIQVIASPALWALVITEDRQIVAVKPGMQFCGIPFGVDANLLGCSLILNVPNTVDGLPIFLDLGEIYE